MSGPLHSRAIQHIVLLAISLFAVIGCATNPVTGERELALISVGEQVAIGTQQYAPSQQMQGGVYVLDDALTAYVSEVGNRMAQVSDTPLPYEFVVLNSSVPNAWALPGGKIAINRGLLVELETEAELAAVLGHEVTHAAAGHGAQAMQRGLITQGALTAAAIGLQNSDYAQWSDLALGSATIGAQLLQQRYGRDAERESDYYGMVYMRRAGYDPAAAVSLQETFVRLSEGRRSDWVSGLFASHPPSAERVANNRQHLAQLGAGGEVGRERYAAATRRIRELRGAYQWAEEGREAWLEGNVDRALSLADQALDAEPREARFHALRAQVLGTFGDFDRAIYSWDRAVELEPGYFLHWQGRGLVRMETGQQQAAERDLARAAELLPTAQSMNALGQIALQQGDRNRALQYLRAASGSNSSAGREAGITLARLELETDPARMLPVTPGLSETGELLLRVDNRAPIAVTGIVVAVAARHASGTIQRRNLPLQGSLDPGRRTVVRTGLQFDEPLPPGSVEARVLAARPR